MPITAAPIKRDPFEARSIEAEAEAAPERPALNAMPVHCLIYAEPGAGKSTLAATFPKPLTVALFDPIDKGSPYYAIGENAAMDETGVEVTDLEGERVARIEFFHDLDPQNPTAYARFLTWMATDLPKLPRGGTLVIDSVSFMNLAAHKQCQYVLNPDARDPRQWYAGATETLTEVLMMRLAGLSCNVVVLAHVDEGKDELNGNFVRNPAAPGKLSKRLASAFGEFYRIHVALDDKGNVTRRIQTAPTPAYNASTQRRAKNGAEPTYDALGLR